MATQATENNYNVLIRPIVTEQSMVDVDIKRYTFQVANDANKHQIKDAVESIFGVKVAKVNTMNVRGKVKRMGRTQGKRADWKKAIVVLTDDSKEIKLFQDM